MENHAFTPQPQTRLPLEILQEICHIASQLSTQCAYCLCLVSSWTRLVAMPNLYYFIILPNSKSKTETFYDSVTSEAPSFASPSLDNLAKNTPQLRIDPKPWVRAIRVQTVWPPRTVDIIMMCPNLHYLALNPEDLIWLNLMAWSNLKQRNLDILLTEMSSGRYDPLFAVIGDGSLTNSPKPAFVHAITKLRICLIEAYYSSLRGFKELTHVSVPFCYQKHETTVLERWIEELKLEVLIVVVLDDLIDERQKERLIVWMKGIKSDITQATKIGLAHTRSDRLVADWEAEIRGDASIWSLLDLELE